MNFYRPVLLIVLLTIPFRQVFPSEKTDYLNYMFFNSHMNHLRTTHERAVLIGNEEVFSLITDIRYTENSTGGLMSIMYGAGYVDPSMTLGIYYLGFTSDLGFTMGVCTPDNNLYRNGFGASGIGISLFISPIALITLDWTFAFDKNIPISSGIYPVYQQFDRFRIQPV